MSKKYIPCRLCTRPTKIFLDLGRVPLPEEFRKQKDLLLPVVTYPLRLSYCTRCHHVQLRDIPNMNTIYKKNYCYDFSLTQTGRRHWQDLARDIVTQYRLTNRSLVVDVGSNTGTLLEAFRSHGVHFIGIDPSPKIASIAKLHSIPTIIGYFQPVLARRITRTHGQADCITSTNVFDHVENLATFTEGLTVLLRPGGVVIIEVPYALRMFQDGSHTPYLQQLDYMFLSPLIPFFEQHGLTITEAIETPLHGGSLRLTLRHILPFHKTKSMQRLLAKERIFFASYEENLLHFSQSIHRHYRNLASWIHMQKKFGKQIAGIGASAKGMTLLSCAGLDAKDIDFITEKSQMKVGKFTPSGIPIVADEMLRKKQPDIGLILSWNFAKEIKKNIPGFNGRWHTPMPIKKANLQA